MNILIYIGVLLSICIANSLSFRAEMSQILCFRNFSPIILFALIYYPSALNISVRSHICLQILVEYDDVEWQRREWLSPHRDAVFSLFLIERGLYWAERPDPRHASLIPIDHHNHANNNHHQHRINGKPLRGATAVADTVAWPALVSINKPYLSFYGRIYEFLDDLLSCFVFFSMKIKTNRSRRWLLCR